MAATARANGSRSFSEDDVAACNASAQKLCGDPSLIETPELQFFKDFLKGLGWSGEARSSKDLGDQAKASHRKQAAPTAVVDDLDLDAHSPAKGAAAPPPDAAASVEVEDKAGSAPTALSDSDDGAPRRPKECTFGADLDAELRKEHNIAIDDEDGDDERLPRETQAYPLLPANREGESSSAAMRKVISKTKAEALAALEQGNLHKALESYTKALKIGGASAALLFTRASLLLKLKRPLAAIRDCAVALKLDGDLSKVHRLRGTCHRKLGHWRRSHRDLSQAQKLEFDYNTAAIHKVVARKLGLVQDAKTGQWTKQQSAHKSVELASPKARALDQEAKQQRAAAAATGLGGVAGMRKGAKVQVHGIQMKPELNGLRGIIEDFDSSSSRYQVRLDGNSQSHKLKAANLKLYNPSMAEQLAERKQKLEEGRIARRKAVEKRLKQDGIPEMDPSELVEAEMSGMALEEVLCKTVRKLEPDQALEILWQVQASRTSDMPGMLRERVKEILGDDEAEDEYAAMEAEVDPERLLEETVALPILPDDLEAEPDEQTQEMIKMAKEAATEAQEAGNIPRALARYTEAIELGGASALLLAKRAELLLGQKRPCAAIRDCTAALEVNPDCGKAFRIRGVAHRRLGHWPEAHSDLAQGQTLDFDETTTPIQAFVAKRARALEEREASRRNGAKRARLG